MVFVYKKLAQFAVRCALPPRRSESPVCTTDNNPLACCIRWAGLLGRAVFPPWNEGPNFGSYKSSSQGQEWTCGPGGRREGPGDGSPEPGQFPIPDHHSGLLPKDVLAGGNVCWTLGAGQGRLRGIRSETYFQFTKQITCIFPIPKNAQTTAQLHSFHTLVK